MSILDISLIMAYILIVGGALLAILLPLIRSLSDPRGLLKTLGVIVLFAVVFFVLYSISDSEVPARFAVEPFNITPGMSKFLGGLLYTTYLLFVIAILGIVFTEINKALK